MRVANKIKGPEPPEFKTKIGNFVEEENILIDKTKSKNLIRSQSALPYSKKPLNQILEKIDSHVFMGRLRAYEAFKSFDKDKDGENIYFNLYKTKILIRLCNKRRFV